MTYTDKILAEFKKEFCQINDLGHYEIAPFRVRNYTKNDPIKTTYTILKEDIESFITTAIAQAIAEERERMRGEIEKIHTELHNGRTEPAYRMICSLLSSLDKPLTDN